MLSHSPRGLASPPAKILYPPHVMWYVLLFVGWLKGTCKSSLHAACLLYPQLEFVVNNQQHKNYIF